MKKCTEMLNHMADELLKENKAVKAELDHTTMRCGEANSGRARKNYM